MCLFTGLWLLTAHGAALAFGQSLLERTPNFNAVDVPPPRAAEFAFLHRFELAGDEAEKVINYPTLVLGIGLPADFGIGATYASNSQLGAGTPNEWELWIKRRFQVDGAPAEPAGVALAATAAYNTAAESADGELSARVRVLRLTLHGALRGFSDAFGSGESEAAAGLGASFRLTPRLTAAADLARFLTEDSLPAAWSAGIHMVIPGTPHTLGFAVSNVGAATLQGSSFGAEDADGEANLRYGFAFTMPLGTWSQWARIFRGEEAIAEAGTVSIRDFRFGSGEVRIRVGETVRWVNADPVAHSVTADDGAFDSGLLQTGEGYSRRFELPGTYPYRCTPHPFMKGTIRVEPGGP